MSIIHFQGRQFCQNGFWHISVVRKTFTAHSKLEDMCIYMCCTGADEYNYSKFSVARTSLGPWKLVRHMGSSSH